MLIYGCPQGPLEAEGALENLDKCLEEMNSCQGNCVLYSNGNHCYHNPHCSRKPSVLLTGETRSLGLSVPAAANP